LKLENGISCSGVKNRLREEIRILKQEKQWGTLRVICDVDPQ
jgi:primosomal protein N' (replication factor Y)